MSDVILSLTGSQCQYIQQEIASIANDLGTLAFPCLHKLWERIEKAQGSERTLSEAINELRKHKPVYQNMHFGGWTEGGEIR